MFRFTSSLRGRLLILIAVALLPLLALAVFTAVQQWRIAQEYSREEISRIASLAAGNVQRILEGTRQLLDTLAQSRDIRSLEAGRCQKFLQPLGGRHLWYLNLGVIGVDGYLRCRSGPAPRVYLGDRDYFREALRTGEFAVGTLQVGRLSGRMSVVVARALVNGPGQVVGVVYAALDLAALNRAAVESPMPEGATLTIFDRNGVVVARYPEPETWLGRPIAEPELVAAARRGVAGRLDHAGHPDHHVIAYAPVGASSPATMFVTVEIAEKAVVGSITRAFMVFLAGLALVSAIAMIFAWIGSSALVVRPLRAIVSAARDATTGNLSARTGLKHGDDELGVLAAAFDAMAHSLEQRVRELQQTDRALEERNRAYRKLFFENPIPMWLYDRDSLRFLEVNTAAQKQYGYTRDQFLAMNIKDIRPPEEIPRLLADIQGYNELELKVGIWRHLRKDGSEIDVEVSTHDTTWEGARARLVLAYDVTERTRALRAVEESERRFRQLVETAGEGIWITDAEGSISFVNARMSEMLGYRSEEMVGAKSLKFVDPDWRGPALEQLDLRRQGVSSRHELPLRHKDGTKSWMLVSASPILIPGGNYAGGLAMFTDISDLKAAQQHLERINLELEERVRNRTAQLEASNAELEAFAYSVSHDLRAPLRTVDGFAMALREDYSARLDEQALDYIARIHAAAGRMGELIDDLLALSRVARVPLRQEPVDLSTIARAVADDLARANAGREVNMSFDENATAQGDPGLIRIVLENLLDNAWKFTRQQSRARIDFGVDHRDGTAVFFVRDNGVGFDMSYSQRLFGVFQRLHSQREFEGTGVGLATVQRIVRRHGGRVWAEGEVGKGATVYFTLA